MPSLYPDMHEYTIGAIVARLDPVSYTTTAWRSGPTRSQPRFGWFESITLSYEHEDYMVGPDEGITDLVIAGLSYRSKRADDDILPRTATGWTSALRGANEALLSSQGFVSLTASAKAVRSLGHRVRVLARVDGGTTSTPSFRELPPTVRFFAGGDNSVRGYEYESLGPRAENGQVVGGDLVARVLGRSGSRARGRQVRAGRLLRRGQRVHVGRRRRHGAGYRRAACAGNRRWDRSGSTSPFPCTTTTVAFTSRWGPTCDARATNTSIPRPRRGNSTRAGRAARQRSCASAGPVRGSRWRSRIGATCRCARVRSTERWREPSNCTASRSASNGWRFRSTPCG